jgi:MraZ protein
MLDRMRAEALGPKGSLRVALDDDAFDPAGYLSAGARTISLEPDGRFTMPAEFVEALEATDGVMLVGKVDKFQLWNPGRWQARRAAEREKMVAFVRGLDGGGA